jgi:hypothetical protein
MFQLPWHVERPGWTALAIAAVSVCFLLISEGVRRKWSWPSTLSNLICRGHIWGEGEKRWRRQIAYWRVMTALFAIYALFGGLVAVGAIRNGEDPRVIALQLNSIDAEELEAYEKGVLKYTIEGERAVRSDIQTQIDSHRSRLAAMGYRTVWDSQSRSYILEKVKQR